MVKELGISPNSTTDSYILVSFDSASRHHQKLGVATVDVEADTGEQIPISALIVPTIATPIQNSIPISISTMLHLRGLKLAHPVTSNKYFTISLLIGTDTTGNSYKTPSSEEMVL